jgi:hypothetical protein
VGKSEARKVVLAADQRRRIAAEGKDTTKADKKVDKAIKKFKESQ